MTFRLLRAADGRTVRDRQGRALAACTTCGHTVPDTWPARTKHACPRWALTLTRRSR